MADQYQFHRGKKQTEEKRASREEIQRARSACPGTPDHFRQMVERAVSEQCRGARFQSESEKHPKRRKRGWRRVLLPVAATLALGCGALAAGNLWLKPYMVERGFSEEDARTVLVTEPQQEMTELENVVYPTGPVKEMDWQEPLLEVTEAYFDGSSLYFIARGSQESEAYDLYLRDHGSINGYDGITDLRKLEEDSLYLGIIELFDKNVGSDILESDTVQVEMTAIAYPKYEGRIFHAWKDLEAYEKVYGTGAFESDYFPGTTCYVMSKEDALSGYTPQRITVQVPVTQEARDVMEQYISTDSLSQEFMIGVPAETETGEETESQTAKEEETEKISSPGAYQEVKVEGSHVTGDLVCESGSLPMDAEITQMTREVYTGTLEAKPIDMEALKSLYTAGTSDGWEQSEPFGWQYQDQHIFADSGIESARYSNHEISNGQDEGLECAEEGEELEFCRQILERLGKEVAAGTEDFTTYDNNLDYVAQTILEGLPVARTEDNWQWYTSNHITLENGSLSSLTISSNYTVKEKEKVVLLDMEEILNLVSQYVEEGEIDVFDGILPVTEISLEYYVEMTRNGLAFRPVWNFQYSWTTESEGVAHTWDGCFYIDAVTGALVRDTFGY